MIDSEWMWEYKDADKIGRIIQDAASFAQECVNDCRYEEALKEFID